MRHRHRGPVAATTTTLMRPPIHRTIAIFASAALITSLALVEAEGALAAPPAVPMRGETFLTPAERDAATYGMTAQERESIGHLFADTAPGLVVAYARREYDVVSTPGGGGRLEEIGAVRSSPSGSLSVPSHATAGTTSVTRSGTQLFISLTIVKTRSTPPYEWQVYEWAQWGSKGSYSPRGMDCCNDFADSMGVAWAGGLALHSDSAAGTYQEWCRGEPALDIGRANVSNNVGVAHDFHEWWDPDNCPMYWARASNLIRESTWKNRISNVTMKYFHTWGGYDYRLGFSATGPTVSITPKTDTWFAHLYLSFSH